MHERHIEVPVSSEVIREFAFAEYKNDIVSQTIMAQDRDSILEQLDFLGALTPNDEITIDFYEDERLPADSPFRKIRVVEIIRDKDGEVVDQIEQFFLLRADMTIERTN